MSSPNQPQQPEDPSRQPGWAAPGGGGYGPPAQDQWGQQQPGQYGRPPQGQRPSPPGQAPQNPPQPGHGWGGPPGQQWDPPPQGYGYPSNPTPYQGYGPPGLRTSTDAQTGLQLPEGIRAASAGRRIGGFFMEILLYFVTLAIGYFVWTLIVWGQGQTPGKQVLGMRCYRLDDRKTAHWGWMFLRQVVGGFLYSLTGGILFLVSCFMLVLRKDRRTVQDLLAGTVVVHDKDGRLRQSLGG